MPVYVRDWVLASKFGWSFDQIQDAPAVWLDWLIEIDGISEAAKAKRSNPAKAKRSNPA